MYIGIGVRTERPKWRECGVNMLRAYSASCGHIPEYCRSAGIVRAERVFTVEMTPAAAAAAAAGGGGGGCCGGEVVDEMLRV